MNIRVGSRTPLSFLFIAVYLFLVQGSFFFGIMDLVGFACSILVSIYINFCKVGYFLLVVQVRYYFSKNGSIWFGAGH